MNNFTSHILQNLSKTKLSVITATRTISPSEDGDEGVTTDDHLRFIDRIAVISCSC